MLPSGDQKARTLETRRNAVEGKQLPYRVRTDQQFDHQPQFTLQNVTFSGNRYELGTHIFELPRDQLSLCAAQNLMPYEDRTVRRIEQQPQLIVSKDKSQSSAHANIPRDMITNKSNVVLQKTSSNCSRSACDELKGKCETNNNYIEYIMWYVNPGDSSVTGYSSIDSPNAHELTLENVPNGTRQSVTQKGMTSEINNHRIVASKTPTPKINNTRIVTPKNKKPTPKINNPPIVTHTCKTPKRNINNTRLVTPKKLTPKINTPRVTHKKPTPKINNPRMVAPKRMIPKIESHHSVSQNSTHSLDQSFPPLNLKMRQSIEQTSQLTTHAESLCGNKQINCVECGEMFDKMVNLKKHTCKMGECHSRPYLCEVCGQAFVQSNNLNVHMRAHTGHRPFACDLCEKTFYRSTQLKVHQRIHTGVRPYACDICHDAFHQQNGLTSHMTTHTDELAYGCDECDKKFRSYRGLWDHKDIHTGSLFVCDTCDKSFARNIYLTKHHRAAHGRSSFVCELCGEEFWHNSSLKRHQVNNH